MNYGLAKAAELTVTARGWVEKVTRVLQIC